LFKKVKMNVYIVYCLQMMSDAHPGLPDVDIDSILRD